MKLESSRDQSWKKKWWWWYVRAWGWVGAQQEMTLHNGSRENPVKRKLRFPSVSRSHSLLFSPEQKHFYSTSFKSPNLQLKHYYKRGLRAQENRLSVWTTSLLSRSSNRQNNIRATEERDQSPGLKCPEVIMTFLAKLKNPFTRRNRLAVKLPTIPDTACKGV